MHHGFEQERRRRTGRLHPVHKREEFAMLFQSRSLKVSVGLLSWYNKEYRYTTLSRIARHVEGGRHQQSLFSVSSSCRAASSVSLRAYPHVTLERTIGKEIGQDESLWSNIDVFQGSVYPDLPLIGPSMACEIEETILRQQQRMVMHQQEQSYQRETIYDTRWIVRTVAAQCLSPLEIETKIQKSGNLFRHGCAPGALLCVSGGDPGRRFPRFGRQCKDSVYILQEAKRMQGDGTIPDAVDLWAVINPMKDSVGRLESKMEAGASVILSQPPFLRKQSEAWCVAAESLGVHLLIGIPMITSRRSLQFWLELCGVGILSTTDSYTSVIESFPDGGGMHEEEYAFLVETWNRSFIQYVCGGIVDVWCVYMSMCMT